MRSILPTSVVLLFFMLLLSNCAVDPTCPDNLLPIVEIQINNTPSNHDDYLSTTSFTPCRARITNVTKFNSSDLNFPGGVEIESRNINLPGGTSNPLTISTMASGSSSSFFATLPEDGGWFNFFIRGNALSSVDKEAILEMATAGVSCNEVVLGRKGTMTVSGSPPISSGSGNLVSIAIGSTTTLDDYVGWGAKNCRIEWLNPPLASATLDVTLRNVSGSDRLRFATSAPGSGATATDTTIDITLNGNGTATTVYIAGNPLASSTRDKDAIFEVVETGTTNVLSRDACMIRVRKNANDLDTDEIRRFLEAISDVHQTYSLYIPFVNSHARNIVSGGVDLISKRQAHNGSGFLPWHRVYVLHLERLLQASDPSVALHYWKFDEPAPTVFDEDFMGTRNTTSSEWVNLSIDNPLSSWQIPGESVGIRRETTFGSETANNPSGNNEVTTLALGATFSAFRTMESNPHGNAHLGSNNTSWLRNSQTAVRDPLFFLLHSNVERLWAKWQFVNNRYDPTSTDSYDLQGSFASPPVGLAPVYAASGSSITQNRTLGHYLEDTIWPWNNETGGVGLEERPATAPLTPLPTTIGSIFGGQPTIQSTIEYRYMGYDYDDFSPF